MRAQLTAYDNRYKDFIDNVRLNCPSDPNCVRVGGTPYTTYLYRNLSNVRIYGAESRASWAFARNWRVDGAIAYARGENTDTGVAINTVEPLRASFGLAYDVGQWGGEWRLRVAKGKNRVDDSGGAWFRTPGYGINDLAAWFRPTANTRFVVAVEQRLRPEVLVLGRHPPGRHQPHRRRFLQPAGTQRSRLLPGRLLTPSRRRPRNRGVGAFFGERHVSPLA